MHKLNYQSISFLPQYYAVHGSLTSQVRLQEKADEEPLIIGLVGLLAITAPEGHEYLWLTRHIASSYWSIVFIHAQANFSTCLFATIYEPPLPHSTSGTSLTICITGLLIFYYSPLHWRLLFLPYEGLLLLSLELYYNISAIALWAEAKQRWNATTVMVPQDSHPSFWKRECANSQRHICVALVGWLSIPADRIWVYATN